MKHILAFLVLSIASPIVPAFAQTSLQFVIDLGGDAERHVTKYECQGEAELRQVEYLNANPNYLAILTLEGKQVIFANVIAASGVRYASGPYIWWTKGAEASFYDDTKGPDPIATCLEASETP